MAAAAMAKVRDRRFAWMCGRRRERGDLEAWQRGILLAMSHARCAGCRGLGGEEGRPCYCVLRAIFRACRAKVRRIEECEARPFQVRHWGGAGRKPWVEYSRQNEEFIADCHLIARRVLSERDYEIFRLHLLGGADWRHCAPRVGLNRWNFWHAVYAIEERLGRAYRETRPYPLFPLADYFAVRRMAAA